MRPSLSFRAIRLGFPCGLRHCIFAVIFPVLSLACPLAILLDSGSVFAYDSSILGSRYTSVKAAGMGDQFFGCATEGGAALFYNPAILSNFARTVSVEPMNVLFYGNDHFFSLNGLGIQKSLRLDTQIATLTSNPGFYTSSGWAYLMGLNFRGFALGALLKADTGAQAYSDNLLYYSAKLQLIPAIGAGFSLIKDTLRFGYSLQWVNQGSGRNEIPANALTQAFNENLMQGSAFSHTVGLEYSTHWRIIPQVDVVVRNLLGVEFSPHSLIQFTDNPPGVPASEPMMIETTFSGRYKISQTATWGYSIEISDALGASGIPVFGRLGAGLELAFAKDYAFRGGWQLGYPTFGLELNSGTHAFSISIFSKDAGNHYHELEDRRIAIQYQFILEKKKPLQVSPL